MSREHYVTRRTTLDAPDPHDERSLIRNKRALGRPRDLADVDDLTRAD